jgi:hypothetical protein
MKKFIVKGCTVFNEDIENYEISSDVIDLVNVENENETIMANPDDFTIGDFVTEEDFFLKEISYVDDQGTGRGMMAFRHEF